MNQYFIFLLIVLFMMRETERRIINNMSMNLPMINMGYGSNAKDFIIM